jgi:hypothetical protein
MIVKMEKKLKQYQTLHMLTDLMPATNLCKYPLHRWKNWGRSRQRFYVLCSRSHMHSIADSEFLPRFCRYRTHHRVTELLVLFYFVSHLQPYEFPGPFPKFLFTEWWVCHLEAEKSGCNMHIGIKITFSEKKWVDKNNLVFDIFCYWKGIMNIQY